MQFTVQKNKKKRKEKERRKKVGQERGNQGKGCLEIQFVALSDATGFLYRVGQFPFFFARCVCVWF